MSAQKYDSIGKIDSLLKRVLYYDQKVREDYNCTYQEKFLHSMNDRDSMNQSIVIPIIDDIIAGKIKGLSDDSWRACFLVLQHAPSHIQLKYLDFINEYFKKGYILNYEYLIFIDRIYASLRKAQPFGSQSARFKNGKRIFLPMWPKGKRDSLLRTLGINPENVQRKNGVFTFTTEVAEKDASVFSSFHKQTSKDNDAGKENVEELELHEHERGVILMVKPNPTFPVSCGVKIYVNKDYKGETDKYGFAMFKTNKQDNIHTLHLAYPNGETREYELKSLAEGKDYSIESIE